MTIHRKRIMKLDEPERKTWILLVYVAALYVYLHIFLEWIFFITKPSFMSDITGIEKLDAFLESGLFVSVCITAPILILAALNSLCSNAALKKAIRACGIAIPAMILTAIVLILMDNFTYSLFKLGVVTTFGALRVAYGICLIVIFLAIYQKISEFAAQRSTKRNPVRTQLKIILYALIIASGIALIVRSIFAPKAIEQPQKASLIDASAAPNIVLIGTDGLAAEHMSAYGYERDTTPNIKRLMSTALVFENVFTNAATTGGSLVSMLTSKPVTETRVLYFPDTLHGEDAVEHLPGILKQQGYFTEQVTLPHYGDAYVFNLKNGFDYVNLNHIDNESSSRLDSYIGEKASYFTRLLIQRISERVLHLAFIRQMINPFIDMGYDSITDDQRLDEILETIQEHKEPVFIHVHMLDTHGPSFHYKQQVFSSGKSDAADNQDWNKDFYDDAILGFDERMQSLFDGLRAAGEMENTLIILYSDHGFNHQTTQRVPLMIWFPEKEHIGVVKENKQNMDIAPTILDYLGLPIPQWMEGESLLKPQSSPRYMFSANVSSRLTTEDQTGVTLNTDLVKPPFYQIGSVGLIVCDRWYILNLDKPSITNGKIAGHTAPCDERMVPSPAQAGKIILEHLSSKGYDISGIPSDLPVIDQ